MSGCACVECVQQSDAAVVERWGRYSHTMSPGINWVLWPMYQIAGTLTLRVQQLEVRCETKTLDNVFIEVIVTIQYNVLQERVKEAFYELTDPRRQITAYVYDVVRSTLPRNTLDQAFESKEAIAVAIKKSLSQTMRRFGFLIVNALVTDMTPDSRVRAAMNEINTSKRLKEASAEKAEGDKVLVVKAAEAEAESKYLSGVGVARQRKAIVDGLKGSIQEFTGNEKISGTTPKDVVDLLLITQYFDMLRDVGSRHNCATVFIDSDE